MKRQIAMIAVIAALMVAILITKQRCADSVGKMFRVLDEEARRAANPDGGLHPAHDMKH